ncbi:MAG: hypothetical protein H7039_15970 [Bryobacteraceae bacterium]|nr:hypothetical protein [Bryobacteraceae bacterium]
MTQIRLLTLLLSLVVRASAEHDLQMVAWMKTINQSIDSLREMEKKTGPKAVALAERLGAAYEEMIGYWRQHGAPDAVKVSADGKAAAIVLAAAAYRGEEAQAAESIQKIGATCRPCHAAWRETTSTGKHRVKQRELK